MKIVPVDNINLMDLNTLAVMVRLVPFENELIPHFMLMTKEEREASDSVTVMELAALQEGLYLAANKVDGMIHHLFDEIREEKMREFRDLAERIEEMDRHYYSGDDNSEDSEE